MDLGNEDAALLEAKRGIVAIEGIFHAINSTVYSPKFMDALQRGLEYMGQLHSRLIAQIGPGEVENMRKQNMPPPSLVKPN